MPLFEYRCESCGHRFEQLTRAGVAPSCPKCEGEQLEKQLSVFAVSVAGSSASAGEAGRQFVRVVRRAWRPRRVRDGGDALNERPRIGVAAPHAAPRVCDSAKAPHRGCRGGDPAQEGKGLFRADPCAVA